MLERVAPDIRSMSLHLDKSDERDLEPDEIDLQHEHALQCLRLLKAAKFINISFSPPRRRIRSLQPPSH